MSSEQVRRPRRRRWPWVVGILAAVVVLFFVACGVAAVVLLAGSGGGVASRSASFGEEYVSGGGSERVAVIPIEGEISSDIGSAGDALPTTTPRGLEEALAQASDDSSVKAVILEVDSPGGGVTPSAEMHQEILDFERKTKEPVVVSMADTAASGGYYISTAADEIVAEDTTLTGSLGVYIGLLNFSGAAKKYGVTQNYVKSGRFKTMGDPFKKLTPDERKIFQSIVNEDYNGFVNVISEGRNLPEGRVREIADGRVYSGAQAKNLGLVDDLGDLDRAVTAAKDRAHLKNATVVRYVRQAGLGSLLMARLAPKPPESLQLADAAGLKDAGSPQYLYVPGALSDRANASAITSP